MAQKKITYVTISDKDTVLSRILSNMEELNSKMDNVVRRQNDVLKRQDELSDILAEHNVLMRRSLGLYSTKRRFPVLTEENLQNIDDELQGENKAEIISNMTHILGGSLANIELILDIKLVHLFNYDGSKGKKALKSFTHFVSALFEATAVEGKTYPEFIVELRHMFRKIKNKLQKREQKQKDSDDHSQKLKE